MSQIKVCSSNFQYHYYTYCKDFLLHEKGPILVSMSPYAKLQIDQGSGSRYTRDTDRADALLPGHQSRRLHSLQFSYTLETSSRPCQRTSLECLLWLLRAFNFLCG